MTKLVNPEFDKDEINTKAKEFDACLKELIECNYIRLVTLNKSAYIELNSSL